MASPGTAQAAGNRGDAVADPARVSATLVYLARHGQTALNADGRLRGLSDPPLDAVGIVEVGRLGAVLGQKGPTIVISSPLRRARTTAEAIAKAASVETVCDQRLNDRDYGPYTGARKVDVVRKFGSVDAAPGVEPRAAVAARVTEGFAQVVVEYGPGPLVLVSHDAVNTSLLASIDPALSSVAQRTASWNQLRFIDGSWRVELYDQKPEA